MQANLSYWEHQSFFGPAEVAIIGAGLVGLTAAVYLKQQRPTWRMVVLERGVLPNDASTKNADFACFGSISELIAQEKSGDLQAVVAARWAGLARLRALLGDAALDYQPVGGYELFKHDDATLAAECRDKIDYFNALLAPVIGHARTFRDADTEAGRFGFGGVGTLLKNEHEGSLDAGRMMRALLARAWAADVPVLAGCAVENMQSSPAGHHLRLANGATVAAGQVLLATNAFATELLPELAVTPGRGQILVTEPLPGVQLPGTFHYNHGYAYFRQLPDHRILLGGGRNLDFTAEETTAPGLTPTVQRYLENLLQEIVVPGQRPRVDFRWGGAMGFGPALAPIIDWVRPGVLARRTLQWHGRGPGCGYRLAGGAKADRRVAETSRFSYSPTSTLFPAFSYAFPYSPSLVQPPFAGGTDGCCRLGQRLPKQPTQLLVSANTEAGTSGESGRRNSQHTGSGCNASSYGSPQAGGSGGDFYARSAEATPPTAAATARTGGDINRNRDHCALADGAAGRPAPAAAAPPLAQHSRSRIGHHSAGRAGTGGAAHCPPGPAIKRRRAGVGHRGGRGGASGAGSVPRPVWAAVRFQAELYAAFYYCPRPHAVC